MRTDILTSVMLCILGLAIKTLADGDGKKTARNFASKLGPTSIHSLTLATNSQPLKSKGFEQVQANSSQGQLRAISRPLKDNVLLKSLSESLVRALETPLDIEELPFSGILGYQVFLSAEGRVVAIAHVICSPEGYIVLETGMKEGRHIKISEGHKGDWVLIKSPEYMRGIYGVMQRECQTELKELNKTFHGKLEQLLFKRLDSTPSEDKEGEKK